MNLLKKGVIFSVLLLIPYQTIASDKQKEYCDSYCHTLKQIKNPKTRKEGLTQLMSLAMSGDARAKTKIGEIFVYGEYGFKRDCKKGIMFLLQALPKTKGFHEFDPEALRIIAEMFKYGICVKKDRNKYQKYIKRYYKAKEEEKKYRSN